MTIAQHDGIVVKSENGEVTVRIESQSACSSCEAHGKCGFAESKAKEIAIKSTDWQTYHTGEHVIVGINKELGLKASVIAYILPSVIMVLLFVVLNKYLGDLWSALATIAFVALYWYILSLFGKRLQRQFTFHLKKLENFRE